MAECDLTPGEIDKPLRVAGWRFLHLLSYLWFAPCYRFRAWGYRRIPEHGPVLLVSNHQSFLDPIILGLGGHHRRFFAMARSTLFRGWLMKRVLRLLNSIPVDQGSGDTAAMRLCIQVLKAGCPLMIFPEGTRCSDGMTQPFAPGTMLLIKRTKPMVVPVAIEGAFDAWPRMRKLPRPTGFVRVVFGEPIPAAKLLDMKSADALAMLRDQVEQMRLALADNDPARALQVR